ncbi:MAG: gluconate 2-dehydrogenase subunit 3 family protein [Myxococcota bacterium]
MSDDQVDLCFSEDERLTLSSVLDEIIPPSEDGRFPGAGELGLASYIEQSLAQTPALRPVTVNGLAAVDELARAQGSHAFPALSSEDKRELLKELGSKQPAFLPTLILQTYVGYYQNPRVVEALGLEARPPHPIGYETEPNDLTLLNPVRERPKMYRELP